MSANDKAADIDAQLAGKPKLAGYLTQGALDRLVRAVLSQNMAETHFDEFEMVVLTHVASVSDVTVSSLISNLLEDTPLKKVYLPCRISQIDTLLKEYQAGVITFKDLGSGEPKPGISEDSILFHEDSKTIYYEVDLASLGKGTDNSLPKEHISQEEKQLKATPTAKDVVQAHLKERESYYAEISIAKAAEIADGKISEKELIALSETLTRIPRETWDESKTAVLKLPIDKIYMWALPHAQIVFPFLNLRSFAENIETTRLAPQRTWGLIGDIFYMPKYESVSDSNIWVLLRSFVDANYGRSKTKEVDPDDTVPELSNDKAASSKEMQTIIIRLLELAKSPTSATIRVKDLDKVENTIRNQVDFVVLDRVYSRDSQYEKLSVSNIALTQGRRTEKVSRPSTRTRKIVVDEILTGYTLSKTLEKFLPVRKFKSPENEPFIRFILDLLKIISDKIDINTYQIPSVFLTAPATRLRQMLRKGPSIKSKTGKGRANLYIPFSYAKAAECADMPETCRKLLTDTGAEVVKNLDTINKLTVKDAAKYYGYFEQYITRAYIVADECRKQWRREGKIPNSEDIKDVFGEKGFPNLLVDQTRKYFESSAWEDYLRTFESFKLTFKDTKETLDEQKALKASIIKIQEEKKKRRQ